MKQSGIVFAIRNVRMQTRLSTEPKLTLKKAVKIISSVEVVEVQAKLVHNEDMEKV